MTLFVMIALIGLLFQQPAENVLGQAEVAYFRGDFAQAIDLYEQALTIVDDDPAVYYNLATAYLESGLLGEALVNYRRAQRIFPRDSDVAAAISRIRVERVDFQGDESSWIDRLATWTTAWITATELHIAGLLAWMMWLTVAGMYVLRKQWRRWLRWGVVGFAIPVIVLVVLVGARTYADSARPAAVVIELSTMAMSGPGEDYVTLFQVYSASELRIIDSDGDWLRCQLPDGRQGWFAATAIEEI